MNSYATTSTKFLRAAVCQLFYKDSRKHSCENMSIFAVRCYNFTDILVALYKMFFKS